jgi:hypothetical protein
MNPVFNRQDAKDAKIWDFFDGRVRRFRRSTQIFLFGGKRRHRRIKQMPDL